MSDKKRVLVEAKEFAPLVEFKNFGDSVSGKILAITEGKTKFSKVGEKDSFITLEVDGETGKEERAILLTAGLKSAYDWDKMIHKEIELIYSSSKPTSNGEMKVFELYLLG